MNSASKAQDIRPDVTDVIAISTKARGQVMACATRSVAKLY